MKASESDVQRQEPDEVAGGEMEQQELRLLVPICVNLRQERADDGTCSRWALECIAWNLVDASSGRLLQRKTVSLHPAGRGSRKSNDNNVKKQQERHQAEASSLADAIKQIDESIESHGAIDKCALVTCGPLHLRQHLHPAAMRAEVRLSSLYDRYLDLPKEFQRTYQPAGQWSPRVDTRPKEPAPGNEASFAGATSSGASCASSVASSTNGYSATYNGGAHLLMQDTCYPCYCCYYCDCCSQAPAEFQHQAYPHHQEHFYSAGDAAMFSASQHQIRPAPTTTTAAPASATAARPKTSGQHLHHNQQQQQQQLRQSLEMLKFLSIESQSANCTDSQLLDDNSAAAAAAAAASVDELEEVTRCEKCHLAASAVAANGEQKHPERSRRRRRLDQQQQQQEFWLSPPSDDISGGHHDDSNDDACKLEDDQDQASDRATAVGVEESSSATGGCHAAALAGAGNALPDNNNNNNDNDDDDDCEDSGSSGSGSSGGGKRKPPAPVHCLACSSLASSKLVDSMSLVIERMLKEGHRFNRFERIKRVVEVGLSDSSAADSEYKVVRARGLPWQATEQDIANFFVGLNIARGGVGLCLSRQGRRNGEALIQFESREHRNLALGRHKHFMSSRYIEVYRASGEDFTSLAPGYNNRALAFLSKGAQVIVRMRGLPFTCTSRQVVEFFSGSSQQQQQQQQASKQRCEVLGQEEGVLFVKNQDDKPTGDAFVLFANEEFAQRALQKHKQNIGPRYVELFRSSISEVQQVLSISMDATQTTTSSGNSSNSNSVAQAKSASGIMKPANNNTNNNKQQRPPVGQAGGFTYAQAATSSFASVAAAGASKSAASETIPRQAAADLVAVAAADKLASGGSSTSSAFDSNSLNSEMAASDELAATSGGEDGAVAGGAGLQTSAGNTSAVAASGQQTNSELLSSSSAAQSPISSLSAASTGSSSYRSSQYSGGQRGYQNNNNTNYNQHHSHNQRNHSTAAYSNNQNYRNSHYHQHHHHNNNHHQQQQQQQQFAQIAAYGHYAPVSGAHLPGQLANGHRAAAGHYINHMAHHHHHHHPHTYHHAAAAAYPYPPHLAAYPASVAAMHHQHQLQLAAAAAAAASAPAAGQQESPSSGRHDCVRLRGLPFEAQVEDVLYFLGEHSKSIVYQGVHMVYSAQGQPSGEAIVQLNSAAAASAVAQEFHKKVMSVGKKQRYIEVATCSIDDLHLVLGMGLMPAPMSHAHQHNHLHQSVPPFQLMSQHPPPPQYAASQQQQQVATTPSDGGAKSGTADQHDAMYSAMVVAPGADAHLSSLTESQGSVPIKSDDGRALAQNESQRITVATSATGEENAISDKLAAVGLADITTAPQPVDGHAPAAPMMPAAYYPVIYYYPQHPQMLSAPPYH